jgi:hypothetical protein
MSNASATRQGQNPELSVVVVVLSGGASLRRCLDALRPQLPASQLEIVVPHDDALADAAAICQEYSAVRFLHERGRRSFAQLRAAGVRAATGQIVAITEDQCIPPGDWCANAIAAHASPHPAIGGPVEKHEPDTALGWAIYLREFTGYIPPVREGPSAALTDCNVSYKREALEAIRDVWAEAFHEPDVHAALRARGGTLWLSPKLVTRQQRTMPLGTALRERRDFGRLYGSLRVKGAPAWKRFVLIIVSPLLPLLLTGRVVMAALRKGRYVGACLRAFPHVALFAAVWGWGELLGYLTGTPPETN